MLYKFLGDGDEDISGFALVSLWFQISWFVAVLGTENWQLLMAAIVFVTLVCTVVEGKVSVIPLVMLALFGVGFDSMNIYSGILTFRSPYVPLWLIFAWYVKQLLPVLSRWKLYYVIPVGGAGGTMSYLAGAKLGAVELMSPAWISLSVLMLEWIVISAVFIKVLEHEKGLLTSVRN